MTTFHSDLMKSKELLAIATEFNVGVIDRDAVLVRRCEGYRLQRQPYMWKVEHRGFVLAKDGEWEYEPLPSGRCDDFYKRCRFDAFDDALKAAREKIKPLGSAVAGK